MKILMHKQKINQSQGQKGIILDKKKNIEREPGGEANK